jgi:hypothetical protein
MSIELSSSSVPSSVNPSVAVREYEFDEYENVVIEKLSSRLALLSYSVMTVIALRLLVGVLAARHSPAALGGAVIEGLLFAVFAASMLRASRSLKSVVRTEGDDVSHLMSALGSLSQAYSAQWVLVVLSALGLVIVALALAFA